MTAPTEASKTQSETIAYESINHANAYVHFQNAEAVPQGSRIDLLLPFSTGAIDFSFRASTASPDAQFAFFADDRLVAGPQPVPLIPQTFYIRHEMDAGTLFSVRLVAGQLGTTHTVTAVEYPNG